VKHLYFLKKEFDDKINNNEIFKMTYKTYILKMKNIRYIVIYDNNQHPLYIYNLELTKVIDIDV
jgi:glutathione peroxidase-family protein